VWGWGVSTRSLLDVDRCWQCLQLPYYRHYSERRRTTGRCDARCHTWRWQVYATRH